MGVSRDPLPRWKRYYVGDNSLYMFIALGIGQYSLALFHLANHAAFKAMLFMAAGAIIHAFMDQQDLRRFGGLVRLMPFVYSTLVIGSLSLMAIPYLTGWYSKDGILEVAVGSYSIAGSVIFIVGSVVAMITAFYSVRLVLLAFNTPPRSDYASYAGVHEANAFVIVPLIGLSLLAIGLGYVTADAFRGFGSDFLAHSAPVSPQMIWAVDAEFSVPTAFKLTPFLATLVGALAAYWFYMTQSGVSSLYRLVTGTGFVKGVYRFFNGQWQFDAMVIDGFILPGLRLGHGLSKVLDRGILEALGPYGLQKGFMATGGGVSVYSTGILTDYAMFIVLAMLAALVCFTVPGLGLLTDGDSAGASLIMALMVNVASAYMVINAGNAQL